MKNKFIPLVFFLLFMSLSCNFLFPSNTKTPSDSIIQDVDFVTPRESLDVNVQLDETASTSKLFSVNGGSLSLTTNNGTIFTLEIPANALKVDTLITMIAVGKIEGAPLNSGLIEAVQLEPSGLFFNEIATLTIAPTQEIPIENQIIFGYEGDGQDYHLAVVDPKSPEIKIKLIRFSGAGIGTGGDKEWAANLQTQANNASTRLWQKLGEATQTDRRAEMLGGQSSLSSDMIESFFQNYYDQVILKELAAAELDCTYAEKALQDMIQLEKLNQLLGSGEIRIPNFAEKVLKVAEIAGKCKAAYQIVGGADDWQTNTAVCDIMKPFTLTGNGFTMNFSGGLSGTYTYVGPFGAQGGQGYSISLPEGVGKPGTMTGGGVGCAGGECANGTEYYTLTPIEPCK